MTDRIVPIMQRTHARGITIVRERASRRLSRSSFSFAYGARSSSRPPARLQAGRAPRDRGGCVLPSVLQVHASQATVIHAWRALAGRGGGSGPPAALPPLCPGAEGNLGLWLPGAARRNAAVGHTPLLRLPPRRASGCRARAPRATRVTTTPVASGRVDVNRRRRCGGGGGLSRRTRRVGPVAAVAAARRRVVPLWSPCWYAHRTSSHGWCGHAPPHAWLVGRRRTRWW